jgi:hypothetical protein
VATTGAFKLIHPPEAAAGQGRRPFVALRGGAVSAWQPAVGTQPLANP